MAAKPLSYLKSLKPPNGETMVVPIHAVYAPASDGPFRCDHCEHYVAANKCDHPEIVKLRAGVVEAGACCDYYHHED